MSSAPPAKDAAAPRPWSAISGGVSLRVRLTPRGGRDAVEGIAALSDGSTVLAARVRAVPEKGAANAALEALLAKTLALPRSTVAVTAGGTARLKTVTLSGDPAALSAALERAFAG